LILFHIETESQSFQFKAGVDFSIIIALDIWKNRNATVKNLE